MRRLPIAPVLLLALLAACRSATEPAESGPAVGAEAPAFDPIHVWGPDKGSHACPMCKYGQGAGVLLWLNEDDPRAASAVCRELDRGALSASGERPRVFVVYMNPSRRPRADVERELETWARELDLRASAVTYVPAPDDPETCGLYGIDPAVRTTAIAYHRRRVVAKWTDVSADEAREAVTAARAALEKG